MSPGPRNDESADEKSYFRTINFHASERSNFSSFFFRSLLVSFPFARVVDDNNNLLFAAEWKVKLSAIARLVPRHFADDSQQHISAAAH